MSEHIVKAPNVPPFVTFVTSAVPMVFDNSLSYYEALCALWKWLQDDVVNVINNNATVTEEYIELTNELKTFVEDYFDNLDVQEEINNKLDAMVEDGTLQEIITDYIQANVAWTFDTVADMKASTNLISGSYAQTLGFRTLNDGGGALYKITNTGTANEMDVIAVGSLYANLIIPVQLSVKQTGAYGDNTHDDTAEIQRALDITNNIYVPKGTYLIDATTSLNINANQNVLLDGDTILKAIPNDQTNYSVVTIDDVDNVNIKGGCIKGDGNDHIGVSGEWGMCLSIINGSSNVIIENVKLEDAWGDGLYINEASNVITRNLQITNDRRNGVSVISVDGYTSENDKISNISGTSPEGGLIFEPNDTTNKLSNILINNLSIDSTTQGLTFSLQNLDNTSTPVSITANNYVNNNSAEGIRFVKNENVIGNITINKCRLIENPDNAIQFRNAMYNANFKIVIDGAYIYRTAVTDDQTQYAAIAIVGTAEAGNIILKDLDINQPGVTEANIADFRSSANSKEIHVINVLHHDKVFSVSNVASMTILDSCNAFESITTSGGGTVGSYEYRSRSVRNAPSSSGDGTVTISPVMPVGLAIEFVNLSQGHYKVQLPADTYCRAYSSSTAPLISISAGGSLKLARLSSTEFIAESSVGTITV